MRLTGRKGNRTSVVDATRLVDEVVGEMARHRAVSEVMNRRALVFSRDTSLESASEALLEEGVDAAPVVDDDDKLVGMVTLVMLSRARGDRDEVAEAPLRTRFRKVAYEVDARAFHAMELGDTVADAMRAVPALREAAPLAQAAAVMAREGLTRLPVVDGRMRVVGTISALDLLGWWASQDGYGERVRRPRKVAS
jgi:CBS domain-containing protein